MTARCPAAASGRWCVCTMQPHPPVFRLLKVKQPLLQQLDLLQCRSGGGGSSRHVMSEARRSKKMAPAACTNPPHAAWGLCAILPSPQAAVAAGRWAAAAY
jgi:hypothetical protein